MVANNIQELIPVAPGGTCATDVTCGTDPSKPIEPNLSPVDPIAIFLAKNPESPIVVDFLNVMIAGTYASRSFVDLYKILRNTHGNTPLIIVTKKVDSWPNIDPFHLEIVTSNDPAVLVVVCDTRGAKKCNREKKDGMSTSVLAEADDYMITLIDYITSASGCRAKVLSNDKYRNKLDVVETMLPYDYYVHSSGQMNRYHISAESSLSWINSVVSYAQSFRKRCEIFVTRKCKSCRVTKPVCVKCITCPACIADARIDFGE